MVLTISFNTVLTTSSTS